MDVLIYKKKEWMRYTIVKILLFLIVSSGKAQSDSILINELNIQKDGLFLSHASFRKNQAIDKESISTNVNKEQIDFYSKVTSADVISYNINGTNYNIATKQVWGFMQNKTLFLNYNGIFYRVPVFGAICYFAGVVEVTGYYTGIYDPMFGPGNTRAVKTKEVHEFMMNYYDGKVIGFYLEELENYLSKDDELFKQYKKLSKRNRRKQASRYIRLYNEKHPIYYLK
jgi:hypothetical protein